MNKLTSTIYNLQILRAFAAINVVIFHIISTSTFYGYEPYYLSLFRGWGANGVDIFFVLSGFVMLHSQLQKRRSPWNFFKFRVIRIAPIYWFVTLIALLAYLLIPSSTFNSSVPSISHILESLFFVSGAISGKDPIVVVGWTLEWEMLFYLVFAASLIFNEWNKSYLFVFISLLLISMITSEIIVIEFLFGMLIAYAFNRFKISHQLGLFITIIGFIFLLGSVNQVDQLPNNRVIMWGLPSFLIIFGLIYAKQYNSPFLKYLGDTSYSIYLIHFLVYPLYYKVIAYTSPSLNYDFLALLCLVICISCGAFLYSFIEKPLTLLIKSKFQ